MARLVAMPKSRIPSDDGVQAEESVEAESAGPTSADVSPLDGDEFLAANRSRREQLRAEAADRVPRKLDTTSGRTDKGRTERGRGGKSGGVGAEAASAAGATRPGRGRLLVGVLASFVVVLAISPGVLAYLYAQADRRASDAGPSDADRTTVLDTARRYAVELTTYDPADYGDLDRRITQISTPEFGKTYIASSQDARKGNANAKGVSTSKAQRAGIESVTADRAVVLVALDQTVKSSEIAAQVPDGIPYQSRVEITLAKRNGTWLLDDLATV